MNENKNLTYILIRNLITSFLRSKVLQDTSHSCLSYHPDFILFAIQNPRGFSIFICMKPER